MTETLGTNSKTEAVRELGAAPRIRATTVLACAWPALLLATVCLLPYLNKPFIIDDPHFLAMAKQIVQHPTHPMDFTICWNTTGDCRKAYTITPGNTLMGYVLVPTVLAGAHEWMAHLTQLVLVWIAIGAMASLILRLGWDRQHAISGALILVAVPPFLPMASTAMPDILATAIALVAIDRLAAWKAEWKWSQGVSAAVALALAGFARSHLVLLLPLAAFFLLDSVNPREILAQIRRKFWLWSPVCAGAGLLLGFILTVREHNLALDPPPVVTGWRNIPPNLSAYFAYFIFPLPLGVCWLANRLKTRPGSVAILLAVAATLALLPWWQHDRRVALLAIVGFGVLTSLLLEAWKGRDHTYLFLLIWILIPLPIVYYVQLPMKYLLPCVPAIILLCFRLMAALSIRVVRAGTFGLIAASAGYSLLILYADAEFANFGRDAMYRLIAPHVAAGERVWFEGQYWSYWYAPLDGATMTFAGGPQPQPGDLLVVDLLSRGKHLATERFPKRMLVDVVTHTYSFGRTMGAGKGLYSNRYGYWLWGFGADERDRYELWRIN